MDNTTVRRPLYSVRSRRQRTMERRRLSQHFCGEEMRVERQNGGSRR
jgi:hypothetical protein